MEWTINVMSAVLLTTLSGTVVFLVWYTIGRVLEYLGFINMVYDLLKAVLIFWFLPISFISLKLDHVLFDKWGGFLFTYTPLMNNVCTVGCIVWMVGAVYFLIKYIRDNYLMIRNYRSAMSIPENGWDCFDKACEELGLNPEKFDVVESMHEDISKIFGLKKPTIVLPIAEFEDEEYRTMFIHELLHYKQKALWLKHLTAIALIFHYINPFMWLFDRKVQEWGENACDYAAIEYIGDIDRYYAVLLRMAVEDRKHSSLQANLVERKGDLENRILRMKRSYKIMKTKKNWTAALTIAVMTVVSTVSVSAATVSAGNTYMEFYNASVVERSQADTQLDNSQELVLYHADGLDEGFFEEEGELLQIQGRRWVEGFGWDIAKNGSKRTPSFSASSGQSITVTVISTPSNSVIHAGIINPDGSRDYVSGSGTFMYSFTCNATGTYCVYVQNMSSGSVHVEGSYIVTN